VQVVFKYDSAERWGTIEIASSQDPGHFIVKGVLPITQTHREEQEPTAAGDRSCSSPSNEFGYYASC